MDTPTSVVGKPVHLCKVLLVIAHIQLTTESGYFKYNKLVVLDAENTTLASEMRLRQDEQGHNELQLVILEVYTRAQII